MMKWNEYPIPVSNFKCGMLRKAKYKEPCAHRSMDQTTSQTENKTV